LLHCWRLRGYQFILSLADRALATPRRLVAAIDRTAGPHTDPTDSPIHFAYDNDRRPLQIPSTTNPSPPSIRRPSALSFLFQQDPGAPLGIQEQAVHLADILNVDLRSSRHFRNDRSGGQELEGVSEVRRRHVSNGRSLLHSHSTHACTHLNELLTPSSASFSNASGLTLNPSTLHLVSNTCLTSSFLYGYVLTIIHLSKRSIGIPCGATNPP
jgi:hypothetical protein